VKKVDKEELEHERIKVIQAISELKVNADDGNGVPNFYDTLLQSAMNAGRDLSCEEFVRGYAEANKVTVEPNGIFMKGDLVRNHKAFFYRMHETWRQYARIHGLKPGSVSRETIALEFEAVLEKQWDEKKQTLRKTFKPIDNPEEFDELLTAFTRAVCGKLYPDEDSVDFRRQKAFIGHFLWQLQMKLHHGPQAILRQGNEAMLLFISKAQKTGKSTTVRRLLETINDMGFVWKTHFDRLEDQFSLMNLAYNYVAWFDDAGRSSVKNMARFKQIVTDDEVNFRAMYTQSEMRMPKMSVLIGTSNKPARELLNDTTGLRRIHQVFVNGESVDTGGGIDLDFLDSFDHERLIRLVPMGEKTSPIFRYITPQELSQYEDEIRPRHIVELWMNDMGYEPGCKGNGKLKPSGDLYQSMLDWGNANGYRQPYIPNAESFGNKLVENGCERGRNGKYRGFYIIEKEEDKDG